MVFFFSIGIVIVVCILFGVGDVVVFLVVLCLVVMWFFV